MHNYSNTVRGLVAGIAAGVVLGLFMQLIPYDIPGDGEVPVMSLVARIVRWDVPLAGWIWHLSNSGFIGAIYGTLCGGAIHTYRVALFWGTLYGVAWWLGGAMILMALFLGLPPFTFLSDPAAAILTLIGHLVFGMMLATVYVWLSYPRAFRRKQLEPQ